MLRRLLSLVVIALIGFTASNGVHADEPEITALQRRIMLPEVLINVAVTSTAITASPVEQEVTRLVNAERARAGCAPVTISMQLTQSAQRHSLDMGQRNYFDHNAPPPQASTPWDRIKATGYRYSTAGENIAAGYISPAEVMESWMESAGHRANILNCKFREIGVGLAVVPGSDYEYYWTQSFAAPR
jgi:uncharacterized protein YkwD